ncbi:MAG: pyrroline-5-carboxylate reductase [Actinobacteria bacterium]|nr:pyrroline-5-carboxylate reductase [Actinomycetota bacterium]MBU1942843.1 pyrroline-5-carboxylate reductase [Actinomycetota bacterium]MBU2687575.1 pyrroline-5-carboxylate reductase [Actinomycetota bacterium]
MAEVALIGAGNMGAAMLRGWLESGALTREQVVIADRDADRGETVARDLGVELATDGAGAVSGARIVFLAVKPQDAPAALEDISGSMSARKVLVSIAAGLTIGAIRKRLGEGPSVVRVMPNMGAQVGSAASGYTLDPGPEGFEFDDVIRLLEAFGVAVQVPEEQMDLVTALSGSGPAYFFLMVEALEEAGRSRGMDPYVARLLARETLWGAAGVLKKTEREAAELRQAVSSPGGTTLAALGEMERAGFVQMIDRAVEAARKRAGELSS